MRIMKVRVRMARKFQMGDTVQVVAGAESDGGVNARHRGKVVYYESFVPYPYIVERKNGDKGVFSATELELIKRKTKKVEKNEMLLGDLKQGCPFLCEPDGELFMVGFNGYAVYLTGEHQGEEKDVWGDKEKVVYPVKITMTYKI